jgi:hypothetical protein
MRLGGADQPGSAITRRYWFGEVPVTSAEDNLNCR